MGPKGPKCFPPSWDIFYLQHTPNNATIGDQNKPQRCNHIEDNSYGKLIFQKGCVHTGNFNQGWLFTHKIIHPMVAAERQLENKDGLNCGPQKASNPGHGCKLLDKLWVHDNTTVEGLTDSIEMVISHSSQEENTLLWSPAPKQSTAGLHSHCS